MLAGFDTTANTLTSSCFVLARHPEIQEKLNDVVMSKCDQYVSISSSLEKERSHLLMKFPYCRTILFFYENST